MMKVVWLSNVDITTCNMIGSGSWVFAMANALADNFDCISITNISISNRRSSKILNNGKLTQINIPKGRSYKQFQKTVTEIINNEQPDIIHVWGTESDWCRCHFLYNFCPVLVDMQGVLSVVAENFYGGLTCTEIIKCIGFKELLKPTSSLIYSKYRYWKLSLGEHEVIKSLSYASVQSDWIANHVLTINPKCELIRTSIVLRPEFYQAKKWRNNSRKFIFSTATMVTPLKGLHLLLKSLSIVKMFIPDIQLRLAGSVQKGLRKGGYARYIISLIKKYDLESNVIFLGEIGTNELIREYQEASVFVNPSYVESYSLVVAESMFIGTPVVASYVGGMSELGNDKESILYFPKGDYVSCAHQIIRLLIDNNLAKCLSDNSIDIATKRNSSSIASCRQMEIYNDILLKC